MSIYRPISSSVWTGRVDSEDGEDGNRWHQVIKTLDLNSELIFPEKKKNVTFLGFECEEGIRRNKGRTGAKKGPEALRKAMANFPMHFEETELFDAGNVVCDNEDLESSHFTLAENVEKLLNSRAFPVILGGGHETAFGHFLGIYNYYSELKKFPKIGIINIDAHFDIRIPAPQPSSGTPFYQIAELLKQSDQRFSYLVLGTHEWSNTKALFKRAEELGIDYIPGSKLNLANQKKLKLIIDNYIARHDKIYLSIDLDVFAAPFAPGVSAPAINGILPDIGMEMMKWIARSGKLISFDVVELNPEFDQDNRTAKLAAGLIYKILNNLNLKK